MTTLRRIFTFFLLTLAFWSCSSNTAELHLYSWGDYIKPELIEQFEKEHNVRVIVDTYDSNEALYAKLKAGATGYDLIFPTSYVIDLMQSQGMLHAIDKSKIPNSKNIDHAFLRAIKEKEYGNSVPYAVTYSGIAYRKEKVADPESSWGIFSRRDLRGRMTILNDIREAFGAALKYMGYSINTTDPAEIAEAADQLIAWKKNLAKFESEQYKNGIASAEYLVTQGYSGDVMQIIREDEDVGFLFPDEGTVFSVDYMAIPKDAESIDLAYAFIDFLLRPEIAAQNIEHTFYRSPNLPAYELLNDKLRSSEILFPKKAFLEKSEVIQNLGEAVQLYNKEWDRVKSSRVTQ